MQYYSPSDPDYSLWYDIRSTNEAISALRRSEIRVHKLSTVESAVLFVVNEAKNEITPVEIARQLYKDRHTIAQLLERMEKRGLIERIKGYQRKNMIQVKLTAEGQKSFKLTQSGTKIKRIMGVLTEKEKLHLSESLRKLRAEAKEYMV